MGWDVKHPDINTVAKEVTAMLTKYLHVLDICDPLNYLSVSNAPDVLRTKSLAEVRPCRVISSKKRVWLHLIRQEYGP